MAKPPINGQFPSYVKVPESNKQWIGFNEKRNWRWMEFTNLWNVKWRKIEYESKDDNW